MKKLIALLLSLSMILALGLTGCSSSSSSDDAEETTEATESEEETTEEEDADDADDSSSSDSVVYPEMTLTVSCSYGETETAGQTLAYFLDYITEASGGNIQFDVYWGATFCSASEDLTYVQNGSVDMTLLSVAEYTDVLPLNNFPNWIMSI